MAREIKITQKGQELYVRGIPDKIGRNETVVAARWQEDGEVKWFAANEESAEFLASQTDGLNPLSRSVERKFSRFVEKNFTASPHDGGISIKVCLHTIL